MKKKSESILGMAFFGPALVLLTIFLFIPMILTLVFSFTDFFALNPGLTHFVGLENYFQVFKDDDFRQAFGNTVKFVVIIVPLQGLGALGLALLINKVTHCKTYFKVAFFIPVVMSLAVVSTLWVQIYSPEGILNSLLAHIGINAQPFINSASQALPSIAVMSAWQGVGYQMIIFLGGLQAINPALYEAAEMALIDTDVRRTFATGIAGLSHVADSLSAIKYAKVKTVRDEEKGIVVDYQIEGDFPKYGNDDDKADDIAVWLLRTFLEKIKKRHTYRNSEPTTSILTITSNVVYGKYTGTMPDGRKAGTPLSPGANPSYGAEQNGLLASLNSLTKLPYEWALDGISNTQTMNPDALGHNEEERVANLVNVMDGYFDQGAHHLNVNVFGKDKLLDAMEHPEKPEYANFTIRVSGYAVKFIDLTKEQQMDVISRTFHDRM